MVISPSGPKRTRLRTWDPKISEELWSNPPSPRAAALITAVPLPTSWLRRVGLRATVAASREMTTLAFPSPARACVRIEAPPTDSTRTLPWPWDNICWIRFAWKSSRVANLRRGQQHARWQRERAFSPLFLLIPVERGGLCCLTREKLTDVWQERLPVDNDESRLI